MTTVATNMLKHWNMRTQIFLLFFPFRPTGIWVRCLSEFWDFFVIFLTCGSIVLHIKKKKRISNGRWIRFSEEEKRGKMWNIASYDCRSWMPCVRVYTLKLMEISYDFDTECICDVFSFFIIFSWVTWHRRSFKTVDFLFYSTILPFAFCSKI